MRLDAPIFYANALTVRDGIKALIAEAQPPAREVIWDTVGQDALDITSINALKGLVVKLKAKEIEIYVAEVHAPVRDFSRRTGLVEMIGKDHEFPTVDDAVRFAEVYAGS